MTVSSGIFDRTNLNTEVANLAAGNTADPEALETVLIQFADQLDANWTAFAAFTANSNNVDGGNFTDSSYLFFRQFDGGNFADVYTSETNTIDGGAFV